MIRFLPKYFDGRVIWQRTSDRNMESKVRCFYFLVKLLVKGIYEYIAFELLAPENVSGQLGRYLTKRACTVFSHGTGPLAVRLTAHMSID